MTNQKEVSIYKKSLFPNFLLTNKSNFTKSWKRIKKWFFWK